MRAERYRIDAKVPAILQESADHQQQQALLRISQKKSTGTNAADCSHGTRRPKADFIKFHFGLEQQCRRMMSYAKEHLPLNSHRIFLYTLVSTVTVLSAVANALKNHSNFYSVTIYLSKSGRSILVSAQHDRYMSTEPDHSRYLPTLDSSSPFFVEESSNRYFSEH
jgi:hypothetical protein